MTEIKKSSQTETTPAPVTVKLSKLTEGVGTIFAGVLTMLEALDADTADSIARSFLLAHENIAADAAEEEKQHAAENPDAGAVDNAPDDDHNTAPVDAAVPEVEETAQKKKTRKEKKQEPVSAVTQDDITKIIVQKIKQNRSNNEKIGQILKTYGVAKVSELPASNYEAFLTDLSAI